MSQAKGFCGHFKALWDNHPSCANCSCCSRQNTCEICCSWPLSTWLKFEQRRSHKARMGKKNTKEKEQFAFSARPVKPKKKSAPAEMFGVDDLSDHTINPGGISSSDDIVPRHTDQPDSPKAKGRGSQCGTPPSGSGFSDWKIRSHSSPDRFTGQRSLDVSTSGEFVDKSTGQLCSTRPGGPEQQSPDRLTGPLSTGKDRTGQKSPTKSTEPDRPGPDRTGRQSPDESTGRGTGSDQTGPNWVSISRRVHRSRDSQAIYWSKGVRLVYR